MQWRYQETVLALCTLAFFVTMVGRLAISPVVPAIVETYAISHAEIGVALAVMWLAYGLAQYPSGILADRHGERRIILIAVAGTALTGLAVAIAPRFALFVLSTTLLGSVAGLHYSVATTLLSRLYDDVGIAIGIHNTGATVAGLLTPMVVAWIAVRFDWRYGVAVVALVGIPTVVLFSRRVRPTEPRRPDVSIREQVQLATITNLLSRPSIAFSLVIAIVGEFTWQATASFLPTFLVDYHGTSTTFAGLLFSAYFVVQGVSQVGVGAVSDWIGRDQALAGCMCPGIAGFGLLLVGAETPAILFGIVLVGIAMSFGPAIMPRFLREFSDGEQTSGFGLVRTVYMLVASTGSVVVGALADVFGWVASFGFLAMLLAAVLLAISINMVFELGY